jgi:hypothetical protein
MTFLKKKKKKTGRGTFSGVGGDENLKINLTWPNVEQARFMGLLIEALYIDA